MYNSSNIFTRNKNITKKLILSYSYYNYIPYYILIQTWLQCLGLIWKYTWKCSLNCLIMHEYFTWWLSTQRLTKSANDHFILPKLSSSFHEALRRQQQEILIIFCVRIQFKSKRKRRIFTKKLSVLLYSNLLIFLLLKPKIMSFWPIVLSDLAGNTLNSF